MDKTGGIFPEQVIFGIADISPSTFAYFTLSIPKCIVFPLLSKKNFFFLPEKKLDEDTFFLHHHFTTKDFLSLPMPVKVSCFHCFGNAVFNWIIPSGVISRPPKPKSTLCKNPPAPVAK